MPVISYKRLMVPSFALMIGLAGCASGGGGGSEGSGGVSGSGRRGSPTRLVAEDLVEHQQEYLYDAIRQLRRPWLTGRGRRGTPRIVVDGAPRQSGFDELRRLRVSEVEEAEYLDPSSATMRFGTGYDTGAILITTRR